MYLLAQNYTDFDHHVICPVLLRHNTLVSHHLYFQRDKNSLYLFPRMEKAVQIRVVRLALGPIVAVYSQLQENLVNLEFFHDNDHRN